MQAARAQATNLPGRQYGAKPQRGTNASTHKCTTMCEREKHKKNLDYKSSLLIKPNKIKIKAGFPAPRSSSSSSALLSSHPVSKLGHASQPTAHTFLSSSSFWTLIHLWSDSLQLALRGQPGLLAHTELWL